MPARRAKLLVALFLATVLTVSRGVASAEGPSAPPVPLLRQPTEVCPSSVAELARCVRAGRTFDGGRRIDASDVGRFCTDPNDRATVTHTGISIKNAVICGQLNLDFVDVPFRLHFQDCVFEKPLLLRNADVGGISLSGCKTVGIVARGLKVAGDLCLRDGFESVGQVCLTGADIGGFLDCTDSRFTCNGREAIKAYGIHVALDFDLRGSQVQGDIDLIGATIGGYLNCEGGEFAGNGKVALRADGLRTGGSVLFNHGFRACGEISLIDACIGRALDCAGGQFIRGEGATALNGDGTKITGSLLLNRDPQTNKYFQAFGEVRFCMARVGSDVDCAGGEFLNEGKDALSLDSIHVDGSVFLSNDFRAAGQVRLIDASVGGYVIWLKVASPETAILDLRAANIGTLRIGPGCWPRQENLLLHGLMFDEVHDQEGMDLEQWLVWLRLQKFRPQPYEQLADVLGKGGREDDARNIRIAKNSDRARTGVTFSRVVVVPRVRPDHWLRLSPLQRPFLHGGGCPSGVGILLGGQVGGRYQPREGFPSTGTRRGGSPKATPSSVRLSTPLIRSCLS